MEILFFISSGLFLGWSLGANDAANIFGTAVGTRMIKFRKAALIGAVFVLLGSVLQGSGTTNTLSSLGKIDALGGAFTVALCSAAVVTIMTFKKLPVSTSQAIVGGIMAWCFFTSHPADYSVLSILIGSWVYGPALGAVFAAFLFLLMRRFIRRNRIHVIKLDSYIRNALLIVGAFGAYSLGANNIANVMGVFVNSTSINVQIGTYTINTVTILFFLGGLSIAIGILTYSRKVMETVGGGILSLTPETAIVVVLAQSLVLFIFSSTSLSNLFQWIGLPAIPLVPVSSTQVVVGSVLGIGLIRGVQEVKIKTLGNIAMGWVITPVLSGMLTFFTLFVVQNVFKIRISGKASEIPVISEKTIAPVTIHLSEEFYLVLIGIIFLVFLFGIFIFQRNYRRNKIRMEENEKRWKEQTQYSDFQKALKEIEVSNIQQENTILTNRLEEKKRELVTFSLNIGEQRMFLQSICKLVEEAIQEADTVRKKTKLDTIVRSLKQRMSFTDETEQIFLQAEKVHQEFPARLNELFPALSEQERRLAILLRIGFSSKEIAPIMNISVKSVEIGRYRLRKRLDLKKDENLTSFIKSI